MNTTYIFRARFLAFLFALAFFAFGDSPAGLKNVGGEALAYGPDSCDDDETWDPENEQCVMTVTGSNFGSGSGNTGTGNNTGGGYSGSSGSSSGGHSGRPGGGGSSGSGPSARERFSAATRQYTDPNARGPEGERYNDPRFQLGGNSGGYEDFTRATCYAAGAAAVGAICSKAPTVGWASSCSAAGAFGTYLACN